MPTFDLGKVVGPQGPQGETGPAGAQGIQGEKGDKGDQGIQGAQGPAGAAGAQGPAGTIEIGTVTASAAGGNPSVTNSGTSTAAVLNFVLPRGEAGPQGATGPQGPQGPQGDPGDGISQEEADTRYLKLTGGALTGKLTGTEMEVSGHVKGSAAPEENSDLANKAYVDRQNALKQDKLTGTQGQIVGFDSSGNAIAQAAPASGVTSFKGRTGAVTPANGDYTAEMVGAVPTTRKINNKALSADVTLSAGDVNAVPTTRTVNGKALSSDITLTAGDVGAYTKEESAEAAENAIEPVGTIKATVRTDLGDKWLLCNGDEISSETYPNLDAILRVDPAKLFVTNKFYGNTFEGTYPEERCFNYLFDEYHLVIAAIVPKNNNVDVVLFYKDIREQGASFTTVTLATGVGDLSTFRVQDFKYLNGEYIIFLNAGPRIIILHSTNSISGYALEDMQVLPNVGIGDSGGVHIGFGNGRYVLSTYSGISSSVGKYLHSTSLSGPWTSVNDIGKMSAYFCSNPIYHDGRWWGTSMDADNIVTLFSYNIDFSSNSISNYKPVIVAYMEGATNSNYALKFPRTKTDCLSISEDGDLYLNIAGCLKMGNYDIPLFYSVHNIRLENDEVRYNPSSIYTADDSQGANVIKTEDGWLTLSLFLSGVVREYSETFAQTTEKSVQYFVDMPNKISGLYSDYRTIEYYDGYFAVIGITDNTPCLIIANMKALPSISSSGCYAYIKAKE